MPDQYKSIAVKPLSGVLETRAMPEDLSGGYVRVRDNFQINAAARMGRAQGFAKFLSKLSGYNNEDLHDQMIAAQVYYDDLDPVVDGANDVRDFPPGDFCGTIQNVRTQGREYITLLYQAVSTSGGRYWIVGTQSRLYELSVATGAYRLLGDGWGGATSDTLATRFRVGQVKDTLIFTNDVDQSFSYTLGDEVNGCAMRATREIPDLEIIKLSKAKDVISFKGHIILLNVAMDGGRLENRFVWSDLLLGAGSLRELVPGSTTSGNANDPRSYRATPSFDPAITDTIAGYSDLPFGHKILRAVEYNRRILIFTNRGIFAADTTGEADKAFDWTELYKHPDGARCLAYPNTLINCGDCIRYMARDGVYRWDSFTVEPEREEWLHRGTGEMFANLNKSACETHVAGYSMSDSENGEERCLEFSYAENGQDVPNKTLKVWPDQRFVSPADYGMTAYGNCQPDSRPSINDFVRQYCICSSAEVVEENIKAGLPVTDTVCSSPPTALCKAASSEAVPDVGSSQYDAEGIYTIEGFVVGDTYLVTFGDNDASILNYDTYIYATGFFVAKSTSIEAQGGSSIAVTLTFTHILSGSIVDGETVFTEDFDAETCDDDSLCALLGDLKLDDICLACEGETVFVGASSRDKCQKAIGVGYSREFCLNADVASGTLDGFAFTNAPGIYGYDGYYSKLVIGPHPMGEKFEEKNVRNVMLELEAAASLVRNVVALRVGYSYSPLDPTKTDCGVVWGPYRKLELSCPQNLAAAEYRAKNLRPSFGKEWSIFVTGRFIYFEITVAGLRNPNDLKSDLVPCLGGESYFSSLVAEARKA